MTASPLLSVRPPPLLFDGLAVAHSHLVFGCGHGDDEPGAAAGAAAAAVGGSGSERDNAGGVLCGARDRILDVAAATARGSLHRCSTGIGDLHAERGAVGLAVRGRGLAAAEPGAAARGADLTPACRWARGIVCGAHPFGRLNCVHGFRTVGCNHRRRCAARDRPRSTDGACRARHRDRPPRPHDCLEEGMKRRT